MNEISEIQVHIEQMIDLLNKVRNDKEDQKGIIAEQREEIRELERTVHDKSEELEGFTEVQISGMGTLQYKFKGKTSLDLINAFHDFLRDQVEKYTGNRPGLL